MGSQAPVRLRFLGRCEITGPVGPVQLETAKTTALLAYLALHDGPQPRPRLAGLLWPEATEERAAGNLRRAVWNLRRRLDGADDLPLVEASRTAVALVRERFRLDVEDWRDALAEARAAADADPEVARRALRRAAALYQGELLEGLLVNDSAPFEEWLLVEREHLHSLAVAALDQLVRLERRAGDLRLALSGGRRLLQLDPWREESHRLVIELLLDCGERGAARAQYETYSRLLAEQLQCRPSPELVRLVEGAVGSSLVVGHGVEGAPSPLPNNLPVPVTPFFGRGVEVERLAAMLSDAACSLVTILGPGGIGKTRLAIQVARVALSGAVRPGFDHGACFVPPLDEGGDLLAMLCDRLGVRPDPSGTAGRELRTLLLDFLREKRTLLVLDAFEHAVAEVELLEEILSGAPEVKLLVTSRQRLGLAAEWLVELAGLDLPASAKPEVVADSAAVQLFVGTARRGLPGFAPGTDQLTHVAEICRRLEGAPLGLELAAGWVRTLPLEELATALARDLSLLSAAATGAAGRLERVFDASWARLSDDEQRALAGLSVFSRGFGRVGAATVAGAGPAVVAGLADKSFLRKEADGRFVLHEVLRHFARRRLEECGELAVAVRERHARYTVQRVAEITEGLAGDLHAVRGLSEQLEELRSAWRWAIGHRSLEVLAAGLEPLAAVHDLLGSFEEGCRVLGEALDGAEPPWAARVRAARARFLNRLGRAAEAERDLRSFMGLLELPRDRGRALFDLADAAYLQGRYGEARRTLETLLGGDPSGFPPSLEMEAWGRLGRVALEEGGLSAARDAFGRELELARTLNHEAGITGALHQLGLVSYFERKVEAAGELFAEALDRARVAGDTTATAQALAGCGYVAEDQGRFDDAEGAYRSALALYREQGDRRGVAYAIMLLGECARRQGRYEPAIELYHEALELARVIGSRFLAGLLLGNLAYATATSGQLDRARRYAGEALAEYRGTGALTIALPALISLAEVTHAEGRSDRALELLGLVVAHPANRQDHQTEADRVIGALRRDVGPDLVARGLARGVTLDLEATIRELTGEDGPSSSPT